MSWQHRPHRRGALLNLIAPTILICTRTRVSRCPEITISGHRCVRSDSPLKNACFRSSCPSRQEKPGILKSPGDSLSSGQAETDGGRSRGPHTGILTDSTESEFKASSTKRADASISPSVVNRPKLKRMEALLCISVSPKAPSTWEGSGMPDAQAAPVEAARCGCRHKF